MQSGITNEQLAPFRFLTPWPSADIKAFLRSLPERTLNFDARQAGSPGGKSWIVDGSDDCLGQESPGPPVQDGLFARARQGVINYDFSDPRIVMGHFDAAAPLMGRNIVLEMKVFGLRYLSGVRVDEVREVHNEHETVFAYRYATLEGHFERGFEWFELTKSHATGEVHFKIEAHWLPGLFPNWWSRLGFMVVGHQVRNLWRRLAPERLRKLARGPVTKPTASADGIAHRGDEQPQRTQAPGQTRGAKP